MRLLSTFLTLVFCMLSLAISAQDRDNAKKIVNLASEKDWTLSIDESPVWRPVNVPGGGYNSDMQPEPLINANTVKDHVSYKRMLTIPQTHAGEVIMIRFGAVNHGCEVYINNKLVTTHIGPLMPFDADISNYVKAGGTYELKVISYPEWHFKYQVPHGFIYAEARAADTRVDPESESGWSTKFGYGITKYIQLVVLPEVYISDVFVHTSVKNKTLDYTICVKNKTGKKKAIKIQSLLDSWNKDSWNYPVFPDKHVTIGAHAEIKIKVGPVAWKEGMQSYWWPNKPFREDYKAKLHNLHITLKEGSDILDRKTQRFGFVEWSEGPYYYKVNGVRFNHISDGTPEAGMSAYDCYATSPAFLPPTDLGTGCPETWKKYMRLGMNTIRIHQSTPTQYMMDVADELGFVLVNETAIRGCQEQQWNDRYFPQAVKELAVISRNHPSVCRYSVQNEASPQWVSTLVDSLVTEDPTRPIVFEDNQVGHPLRIEGKKGHAYAMLHYVTYEKPATIITGMGEYAWHWNKHKEKEIAEGGLNEFVYYGGDMRRWDIAYFAGWDYINYWPNLLQGMSYEKHAWKQSAYPKDRIDTIDGWGSAIINFQRKYFHPYLILDIGIHETNKITSASDISKWPESIPVYKTDSVIVRQLEVFNDGLLGNRFSIIYEGRWDAPTGEKIFSKKINNVLIDPGFHKTITLQFKSPETKVPERKLYLTLVSELYGKKVFEEKQIYFLVKNN